MRENVKLAVGRMEKKLKFSLIVPVYNVEEYLQQCIESCEKQNLQKDDYEIVAVNDGSTDGSLDILKGLAERYGNIVVVSQANAGLSAARNAGLEIARGKYIWFIDSDDWIEENTLQGLYDACESENLDCLALYHQEVDENGEHPCPILAERKVSDDVVDGGAFLNYYLTDCFYAPSFVFKRASWLQYNFQFRKGIVYEDLDLIPMAIARMNRVKSWSHVVYNYRQRASSLVRKVNYKMIDDLFTIIGRYKVQLQADGNEGIVESLQRIMSSAIVGYCVLLSKLPDSEERRARTKAVALEYPKLKRYRELSLLKKTLISIYNVSPSLLLLTLKVKNKLR